ncbi:hypothetical protein [Streptococcus ruminantium]|uniref:Transposase n=1 Tax=Streptococcus ruminantium TaxID=1917441 RepID=A0ABU1B1E0_9STRE|nr:hypothetical protein [Streptococcus ruminantium]MDQ8759235.1 hypothetical protein [Streptococcus ruminantium]MDQ8765686.1 hypothetical protein [Streptococcus ruminantium]MDQ8768993.1 hypothetical protein [Streptococcus ruminantium]MDQ8774385.1 hypothetical protein [Streptococcus ruminantium]MDQ8794310.1 hypothetical protein [Streptococcus ruminantium]
MIVDTTYELPVAWDVTPALIGEPTVAKRLIRNAHQTTIKRAKYLMASGVPLQSLLEEGHILPIIDNPLDGTETKPGSILDTDLLYNQSGEVFWVDDQGEAVQPLYKGYDKSCDRLRYGFHPKDQEDWIFRLKRSVDPIIFNQVARDSKKFKCLYKKRTTVERVNGRLDRDFRLEVHTICGLKKMRLTIAMCFLVMIGFALVKCQAGDRTRLASWVA